MKALWQARFSDTADLAAQHYTASIELDQRLAQHDIRYGKAHVAALGAAGVLSADEVDILQQALQQVGEELGDGQLDLDPALEDIHTIIENRVTEIAGDVGAKLHTGRSRNDQVATDMRLFVIEALDAAAQALRELQGALLERANEHVGTVLPAYSHMQRAQPVSLAHHLLAYFWMLERDRGRFADSRVRAAVSPAGAGACTGTGIPIDRELIAATLDFEGVTDNSLDTVSDRDFVLDFLAASTICAGHCSRLAADLCLWSSAEFGFVKLPQSYCTGSSMMPQKVNPDTLELVRAKVASLAANFSTLASVLHAMPLGYQRDLQEDKRPLLHAADELLSMLALLQPIVRETRFNTERMAAAASDPGLLATDWAEELVIAGVPFRQAHGVIGELMKQASDADIDPRSLSQAELSALHPSLPDAIAKVPDATVSMARKVTVGSTGPGALAHQLAAAEALLASP